MKHSDRGRIIAHIHKKEVTTYKHNTQHIPHTSATCTHSKHYIAHRYERIRTYHAHPQNIYSAPQTKHYSTQHVATLLYSIHTANYKAHTIHFRNKMCTVRYKQYNVSARQLQYMVTWINAYTASHVLYTQMQLSHVHITGCPHNLQRQPWRTSEQKQMRHQQQAQSNTEGEKQHITLQ